MLKTYSGHNATLTIQTFEGTSEVSCRLIHEDAINSPHAMFNTSGGKLQLSLDFHNLYILPDEWDKVKVVVDDMLALWSEYLNTLG